MTTNHSDPAQSSSLFLSVLYIFLAQTVSADLITPVGVIASGRMSDPENMIDGSGMRVKGDRNDYRNWSSLPGKNKTWYEADWFATTRSPGPWTILDLGSICDLETISIWNANPGSNIQYKRAVTKLDVYVRKDLDNNNTHENLAAFKPKGWTLLKRDLAVKPNPGGTVVESPSGLLTGKDLKGIQARYVALHIKAVVGGPGNLRYATLAEVQVFGTSTTGFVYVPDNRPKGYLTPEKRDDGIKVTDLSKVDCDKKPLVGLIHRIETNADNRIDSLLIAKDDTLVVERYFRRAHIDQLHPTRSIIKGVLSLCVGKAIDLGAIKSVDDPILQYFPKIDRTTLVDGIDTWTIRDSLTFSSGLDQKDYKDRLGKQRFKRDTHVAWLLEQATHIPKKKPFQYGPHDPTIINHILSNATGRTFEEYAVEHFFEPMGISEYRFRDTGYGLTYPNDNLNLRSRDVLKIGLLVQNGGVWNGKRLLSAKYLKEVTSPHVRKPGADRSHGYFWALPDVSVNGAPTKTIMKHGVHGQVIYVVPEYGLVVVFTAGGLDVQKRGANEPRELRVMLQKDIIPAFSRNSPFRYSGATELATVNLGADKDSQVSEKVLMPLAHSIGWVKQKVRSNDGQNTGPKWNGILDEKKWGTPSPAQLVTRNWDWAVSDRQWHAWVKKETPTETEEATFDLWIPAETEKVKGVVAISGHGSGTQLYSHPELRRLARELKLALFRFAGNPVQRGFWPRQLMHQKLKDLGGKLNHAEVATAPLFLYGHSNGTGFSALFAASQPDRVWGWISMRPGITFQVFQPGAVRVPGLVIFGENDQFLTRPSREENLAVVPLLRKKHDAVWCQAVEPKKGHGPNSKTWPLVFSFLQHTFEARVTPDGKLVDLKPETGFLGENWDSNQGGYQDLKIAPYSDFIEEQQEGASWLVNEAFAKDWRSFQKFGEVKR